MTSRARNVLTASVALLIIAAVGVTTGVFLGFGPALSITGLTSLVAIRLHDPRLKAWRARRRQYKQEDRDARAAAAKLNS